MVRPLLQHAASTKTLWAASPHLHEHRLWDKADEAPMIPVGMSDDDGEEGRIVASETWERRKRYDLSRAQRKADCRP
jgi:hypothetical protein